MHFEGNGGRVTINAAGIFGMIPRSREELVNLLGTNNPKELSPSQLPTNDITAISQQNPDFSGTVEIITPQSDLLAAQWNFQQSQLIPKSSMFALHQVTLKAVLRLPEKVVYHQVHLNLWRVD